MWMEEILHHLGCKNLSKNGILPYQLVSRISEPSRVPQVFFQGSAYRDEQGKWLQEHFPGHCKLRAHWEIGWGLQGKWTLLAWIFPQKRNSEGMFFVVGGGGVPYTLEKLSLLGCSKKKLIFVGCLMHFIIGYIPWSSNNDTQSGRCWLMTLMILENAGKLKKASVCIPCNLGTSSIFECYFFPAN